MKYLTGPGPGGILTASLSRFLLDIIGASMSGSPAGTGCIISRSSTTDHYGVWSFDPAAAELLTPVPLDHGAAFDRNSSLVAIGGYLLAWSPQQAADRAPYFDYRLIPFRRDSRHPLGEPALQHGEWSKAKFWGRAADFGNPEGGHKQYDTDTTLTLIPLGTYLLNLIATPGRGTYALWNFDPCPGAPGSVDPVAGSYSYTPQGAFRDIQEGHELLPVNGFVLDRTVATGEYRLWSFDPQARIPLAHPPVQAGSWPDIGPDHRLVPVGDYVLDWVPADRSYRLWHFDPKSANPLTGPVRSGTLPKGITDHSSLLGFEPAATVDTARAATPGTVDSMRSRIKHVVYYMVENRSFDHVCGWLYGQGEDGVRFIGPEGPYKGASTEMFNYDGDEKVNLSVYRDGRLSTDYSLEMFTFDPYHDLSDTLRQFFHEQPDGYAQRAVPDMGGFILNNGSRQVMQTYSPEQLPVLNGLARSYAISDEWFCSIPSSTDANRAFSITGSAMMELSNFMTPPQYIYWPQQPHRPPIFKVLWVNGITDWKIYNSTQWQSHVFTYQLFLEGHIPTVDADVQKNGTRWVAPIDQFHDDALKGNLPAFSYLEPIWIGASGTTSYHPGEDMVPAEVQLKKIYDSLRNGPSWNETLLVITFDEHGGIFDHVPPPYAENPWPNDRNDGFAYDLMGPRVPTILVSPWIEEQTVFRSETETSYDSTSFLATLLHWFGVPKSRWFLGERTRHAPTFEGVLTRTEPRPDSPEFEPPYDSNFPPTGTPTPTTAVHDLHLHVAHQVVASMARGKLTPAEISELSNQVAAEATDVVTLTNRLDELQKRFG
jgi:phospholipase C